MNVHAHQGLPSLLRCSPLRQPQRRRGRSQRGRRAWALLLALAWTGLACSDPVDPAGDAAQVDAAASDGTDSDAAGDAAAGDGQVADGQVADGQGADGGHPDGDLADAASPDGDTVGGPQDAVDSGGDAALADGEPDPTDGGGGEVFGADATDPDAGLPDADGVGPNADGANADGTNGPDSDTIITDAINTDTTASDSAAPGDAGTDATDGGAAASCAQRPVPGFSAAPGPALGHAVPTSHTGGLSLSAGAAPTLQHDGLLAKLPDAPAHLGSCLLWRDLDNDGAVDLAWVGSDDGNTAQFRVITPGPGVPKPVSVGLGTMTCGEGCARDCVAADVDGDGKLEVLIATAAGLRVVRRAWGGGWLRDDTLLPAEARDVGATTVDVLDVDRDGDLDVFVGRAHALSRSCALSCAQGVCAERGGFAPHPGLLLLASGSDLSVAPAHANAGGPWGTPGSVSVADPDRDGWPDLLLAPRFGQPRWLRNDGAGGLVAGPPAALAPGPASVTAPPAASASLVADWSGDGRADVAVGGLGAARGAVASTSGWGGGGHGAGALAGRVAAVARLPGFGAPGPVVIGLTGGTADPSGAAACSAPPGQGGALHQWTLSGPGAGATQALSGGAGAVRALALGGSGRPQVAVLQGAEIRAYSAGPGTLAGGAKGHWLSVRVQGGAEGALLRAHTGQGVREQWLRSKTGRAVSATPSTFVALPQGVSLTALEVWFPSGKRWFKPDPLAGLPGLPGAATLTVSESAATAPATAPALPGPCPPLPTAADGAPPPVVGLDLAKVPVQGFVDVTAAQGLPTTSDYALVTCVADFTGDGADDVALVRTALQSATLVVRPGGVATKPLTTKLDATTFYPSGACGVLDVNDDGKPDLVLAGAPGVAVLQNKGDGTFTDVSAKVLPAVLPWTSYTVTPGDFDGDGDVDLYAGVERGTVNCNKLTCSYAGDNTLCLIGGAPTVDDSATTDRLLLWQGAKGFVDVTTAAKVPLGTLSPTAALSDLDRDGRADLIVTDDFGTHRWLRWKGGQAETWFAQLGWGAYLHGMGSALLDLNRDGRFDVWTSDIGQNAVHLRVPDAKHQTLPLFRLAHGHEALPGAAAGAAQLIARATKDVISWSPLVADLDHDGSDDVYLPVSGWLAPKAMSQVMACKKPANTPAQHDLVFRFPLAGAAVVTRAPESAKPTVGPVPMAAALVDVDLDGDLDVVQVRPTGALRILRNDLGQAGKWAKLRLQGAAGNRLALGARVEVVTSSGKQLRLVGATGFGGGGAGAVHVGLGKDGTAQATVWWPTPGAKPTQVTLTAGKTTTVSALP